MIVVKKIGISFNGPSIIIMYSNNEVTRKREMPLRDMKADSDCRTIVNRLKKRHTKYLESVSDIRLEKLVMIVKEHLKGVGLETGLKNVESILKVDPEENMNKLTDIELKRRKEIMDLTFEKNSVGKGHPDFVYDKEVEFKPSKDAEGWDDESDEDETTKNNKQESPILSAAEAADEDDFW
eukprot:GFUD01042884.1.p1 GENE.GFUD01042884.1~~GFUD01042884.1.p1  ORF type:complete len:181 (+),score=61.28 GFUD01042884.1:507-1049(+)